MRRLEAILTAVLVVPLAGCVVGAKPKTVAAAPAPPKPAAPVAPAAQPEEKLSIPQTQVQLPLPQPFDPDSLTQATPEPAAESSTPSARSNRGRSGSTVSTPPRPEAAAPAPPTPEPRAPLQDVVPPSELKRWQDSAQARRKAVHQWLDAPGRRHLSRQQQATVEHIRAFLKDSDSAEQRGDMREADALAERAQILLKELQNGK